MSHALNKLAAELGHAYRTAKKTLPAEDRLVPVLRDLLRDIGQRLRPSPGASLQANVARGPEHVPALLELFSALASPGTPPAGALCPAPLSPPPLRRPGVRFGGAEQLEFEVSSDEVSHKLRPGRRASSLPEPSSPARAHSVATTTLRHYGRARARRRRAQLRTSGLWRAARAGGPRGGPGAAAPGPPVPPLGPTEFLDDHPGIDELNSRGGLPGDGPSAPPSPRGGKGGLPSMGSRGPVDLLETCHERWIEAWLREKDAQGLLSSLRNRDLCQDLQAFFGPFSDVALVDAKLCAGRLVSLLPLPGSVAADAHEDTFEDSEEEDPSMELIDEDGNPRDFISVEGADLEPLGETEGPSWDEGVEPPARQCGAVPGLAAATCPAVPDLLLAGSLAERIRKVSEDNNKRLLEEIREELGKRDAPVA
mmetsp:Transcript_59303/g.183842  ORF Transcript_59303/g.183842 Transcript_59303/m.183842 type:complete len:423 (-) Transcript_59303:94-1362(-)